MRYDSCKYALLMIFVLLPSLIWSTDAFEIQVYDGAINDPGQLGLELHTNVVASGRKTPAYDEEIPPHGLTHFTIEPSIGVTRYWELGAYLQTALDSNGAGYYGGAKLRSKLMIPPEKTGIFKIGLNIEIGKVPKGFENGGLYSELRPIIRAQKNRWMFAFNPNVEFALDGSSIEPEFGPAFKFSYDTGYAFGVGAEYYADYGAIAQMDRAQGQSGTLYLALDLIHKDYEFNLGIGHGVVLISDGWVIKTIFGHGF